MMGRARRAVAPCWLVACLMLGGSTAGGAFANLLLQLGALILIGIALARPAAAERTPAITALFVLLAAALALIVLTLLPLPPSLWRALPGRSAVANGFALLGAPPPWLPLSLTPEASLASALWLLPAIALLLAVVRLRAFSERGLAWAVLAAGAAGLLLGTLQLSGGEGSSFYFYRITNYGVAVGSFANANHFATLLICAIPFMTALYADARRRQRSRQAASVQPVLLAGALLLIAVGLAMIGSLAGLGLLIPVAAASMLLVIDNPRLRRLAPWGVAALAAASIAVSLASPFGNNLTGTEATSDQFSRYTFYTRTFPAALAALPFGTGLGSFQRVYPTLEDPAAVTTTFVNHAHNDYLELLLETGLPGLLLVLGFLAWWTWRTGILWRSESASAIERAATIASGAILVHSAVDYPLRTAAIAALMAACCGLMTSVRPFERARRARDGARHLSAD